MAAAGHRQRAAGGVVLGIGQGQEVGRRWPSRSRVSASLTSARTAPGGSPFVDGLVEQRPRHGHDQRRGQSLAHHVAADDAQPALRRAAGSRSSRRPSPTMNSMRWASSRPGTTGASRGSRSRWITRARSISAATLSCACAQLVLQPQCRAQLLAEGGHVAVVAGTVAHAADVHVVGVVDEVERRQADDQAGDAEPQVQPGHQQRQRGAGQVARQTPLVVALPDAQRAVAGGQGDHPGQQHGVDDEVDGGGGERGQHASPKPPAAVSASARYTRPAR